MIITCCTLDKRPRIDAGVTSEMYTGEITLAAPTPKPPMMRATMNRIELLAPPASSALTRNSTAAPIITVRRP
ncbi:hypothetical protein D9M73_210720 [compost metagenome]